MKPSIATRIKMLRIGNKELAERVGVDPRTVGHWRAEEFNPHPIVAKQADRVLSEMELPLRDHLIAIHGIPNGEG